MENKEVVKKLREIKHDWNKEFNNMLYEEVKKLVEKSTHFA